jgi:hypothetical protein
VIAGVARADVKIRFEHWPVVWIWPVGLVLMQLRLLAIGDFEVSLGVVACHLLELYLFLFYWLWRPPAWQIALAALVLLYSLALGASAEEPVEFWQSFLHVANLLLMMLLCLNARIEDTPEIRRSLAVFCTLAIASAAVIVAQALTFNLWRDFRLAAILGPLQPIGPGFEVFLPSMLSALPRANGVYAEPSVAGWFMSFALAVALAARRVLPRLGALTALACGAGAVATLSLTGILGATIVVVSYLLFVRDPGGFKPAFAAAAGSGLALALYAASELGILGRFANIDEPGTSIYFRLAAPYRLINESLVQYPFGHAVGQTGFIETQPYFINWEEGSQTNIDNSLLMIVFYFGLLGILANATYLAQLARYLLMRRHAVGLVMMSLTIALLTTGAGWAHHFVLMIGYAILVGRYLLSESRRPARRSAAPRPVSVIRPRTVAVRAAGTPAADLLRLALLRPNDAP